MLPQLSRGTKWLLATLAFVMAWGAFAVVQALLYLVDGINDLQFLFRCGEAFFVPILAAALMRKVSGDSVKAVFAGFAALGFLLLMTTVASHR